MATTKKHTGEYSEKTLESFHKIFGHIREFPDIDPSVGEIDDTNYEVI